jgi:hypothetical protein
VNEIKKDKYHLIATNERKKKRKKTTTTNRIH